MTWFTSAVSTWMYCQIIKVVGALHVGVQDFPADFPIVLIYSMIRYKIKSSNTL